SSGGNVGDDAALGLRLAPLTDQRRAHLGLPDDVTGAVVVDVNTDSVAAEKGIRPGDVVTQVNHRDVASVDAAVAALKEAQREGANALVLVRRGDGQRFVAMSFS